VTRSAAWKAYKRKLAATRELIGSDEIQEHVHLALHRLDHLFRIASKIASSEEPAETRLRAVDRILRLEERRARLLGLDAPQRAGLGVIRSPEPNEPLTPEQTDEALRAFGMPAAIAVHLGPNAVAPPSDA
jgi:hypothetical protein